MCGRISISCVGVTTIVDLLIAITLQYYMYYMSGSGSRAPYTSQRLHRLESYYRSISTSIDNSKTNQSKCGPACCSLNKPEAGEGARRPATRPTMGLHCVSYTELKADSQKITNLSTFLNELYLEGPKLQKEPLRERKNERTKEGTKEKVFVPQI